MRFVCSNNPVLRVLELPPELMTDHCDFEGIMRFRGILNIRNDSACRQKQNQDNQNRNYRPGCLYLGTAVNLRWFVLIVVNPFSEFDYCVSQQAEYEDKHCCRNRKYEKRQPIDRLRRS